jgi:predicted O-methyltransferase YrrM
MNDAEIHRRPQAITSIVADTEAMSFTMISEPKVGALLAVLAATKPAGRFLELGTGTGHGTAWLLAGMDAASSLDTVDTDEGVVAVARRHLGADRRVVFHVMDGAEVLVNAQREAFDPLASPQQPR